MKDRNIVQAMAQAQARSVDEWAFYQAKSTKQKIAEWPCRSSRFSAIPRWPEWQEYERSNLHDDPRIGLAKCLSTQACGINGFAKLWLRVD